MFWNQEYVMGKLITETNACIINWMTYSYKTLDKKSTSYNNFFTFHVNTIRHALDINNII